MTKYIKYLFVFLAAVGLAACSSDDDPAFGSISGTVYDYATHEPLSGVQVSLNPNHRSINTDASGNFNFSSLDNGAYTVSASLHGYETATSLVVVHPGEITRTDISLKSENAASGLVLSTQSLTFDKGVNELTFSVRNVNEKGSIKWNIDLVTVDWLIVTPREGTLDAESSTALKVIIDRTAIAENKTVSTSFNFNWGNSSTPVSVLVNNVTGGNESPVYGLMEGCVFDSETNEPIANAQIVEAVKGLTTRSDSKGIYRFDKLTPGDYNFEVTAEGYAKATQNVYVGGGTTTAQNFYLKPDVVKVYSNTDRIEFGLNNTTMSIILKNDSGKSVEWKLFEVTGYSVPSWLSIDAKRGTIGALSSQTITLSVDRSKLNDTYGTYLASFESPTGEFEDVEVMITVEKEESDEPVYEDYSSATVYSCDSRVEVKIVGCHRSGKTVTFDYALTNNGLGNVNDWRIYPPKSMSLIQGGTRSVVWTSDGVAYDYPTMEFNGKRTTGANVITASFPEGPAVNGSVTISGVSSGAEYFNLTLGVYAYPNSYYQMATSAIEFKNVRIY